MTVEQEGGMVYPGCVGVYTYLGVYSIHHGKRHIPGYTSLLRVLSRVYLSLYHGPGA